MSKRRIWFWGSLTVLIVTTALLITGSSLLTQPLSSKYAIPLGTPITWLGMISLPLTIFLGVEKIRKPIEPLDHYLSRTLGIVLIAALFWAPISYGLAGNFSFSFTEKEGFQGGQSAMRWFWRFSYGIVVLPIILLMIHWISLLFAKVKEKK